MFVMERPTMSAVPFFRQKWTLARHFCMRRPGFVHAAMWKVIASFTAW